jgi:hypothetical protein
MLDGDELRALFADAVDELAVDGRTVRGIERRLIDAGLSHTIAKRAVSLAKEVAKLFDDARRNA